MKTSFHIAGFWFHVQWDAEGRHGVDQHGGKWVNKECPEPVNKSLVDACLDAYNAIKGAFAAMRDAAERNEPIGEYKNRVYELHNRHNKQE